MNELDLIRRIAHKAGRPGKGIVAGIGDDCAIFRPEGSREDLVLTTDLMLENVHFRRETHPPEAVGWKTLARGISDVAAMGGQPRFCLLSLALAPWTDQKWLDRFYRGLLSLARKSGAALVGGDLGHAERFAADIVVCGSVSRGEALLRSTARAGDAIYVSGRLGGSALGLEKHSGPAWRKHLRPEPRITLGQFLRERLHATACMDLSDGLSLDLHRLCVASRVAADLDSVPLFRGATLEQALHGGEDYELLFTVRAGTPVPKSFRGIPLSRIGAVRRGRTGEVRFEGRPLRPAGYDHLARR